MASRNLLIAAGWATTSLISATVLGAVIKHEYDSLTCGNPDSIGVYRDHKSFHNAIMREFPDIPKTQGQN